MTRDQKGFANIIVVILVVALLAVGAFAVARVMKKDTIENQAAPASDQVSIPENESASSAFAQTVRDNQRKNHLSLLLAGIAENMANNNGKVLDQAALSSAIGSMSLGADWIDPSTKKPYEIIASPPQDLGKIYYASASTCAPDPKSPLFSGGLSRDIAVMIMLENGNYYCAEG